MLFVIPWGRHWIIGTTDADWALDKAHPAASSTDIDYLLNEVNKVLATPLTRADVEGVYAGLRPLLAGESDPTSKLSREHTVASPVPGLVVVAGGKYTTYRVMALDAVDAAVHGLGGAVPASCTERVPLVGADGFAAVWNQRWILAANAGLHIARVEQLLARYGSLTHEVLDLIRELHRAGTTVILISHNMAEVVDVATRVVVFKGGRKIADRPAAGLTADDLAHLVMVGQIPRQAA